jgi:chromosome segregation ATPase
MASMPGSNALATPLPESLRRWSTSAEQQQQKQRGGPPPAPLPQDVAAAFQDPGGLASLDTNRDGSISANEVLAAYDQDGDGELSRGELKRLADQLSQQTDFNNTLLEKMQQAETQALRQQRDAQAKQTSLRKALRSMEQAREEASALKQEITSVKQNRSNNEVEMQKMKRDVERCRRDVEISNVAKRKAQRAFEKGNEERMELVDQLQVVVQERNQNAENYEHTRRELAQVRSDLSTNLATLSSKLSALATSEDHWRKKCESQENAMQALVDGAKEKELRTKAAEAALLSSQRQCAEFEGMLVKGRETQTGLRNSLDRNLRRMEELAAKCEEAQATEARQQDAVRDLREKLSEATRQAEEAQQANGDLRADLRDARDAHRTVNEQRAREQAAFQQKVEENHDQLNDLASEARSRHQEYAKQAATMRQEQREQLGERDEKYVKLQNDYKGLHEILAKVQAEHSKQIKMFQDERNAYEKRIMEALNKANNTDKNTGARIAAYQQEQDRLKQQANALQRELHVRSEQHLQTLEKVQHTYRLTIGRVSEENNDLKIMRDDVDSLKRTVQYQMTHMLKPHEDQHASMQQNVMTMNDMMQKMKEDYNLACDAKYHAEALAEEQRSENIMLNDEISKLEMSRHGMAMKLESMEDTASAELKVVKVEHQAAMASRDGLESQLRRTMEQLEQANQLSRKLQVDNRDLHTQLHEFQQEMGEKAHLTSKQLHDSRLKEQGLAQNNESLEAERDQLRRELEQQSAKVQHLQHEIIQTGENYRSQISTEKINQGKYKAQVHSLGDSFRKMQTQLGQTKQLLGTIQEQRKLLSEDNDKLRAELDEVYNKMTSKNEKGFQ